jgi:hypothetical protein
MLVKTERKLNVAGRILMGNEYYDTENIFYCFDGSEANKISAAEQSLMYKTVKDYYSMVISSDPVSLTCPNSPFLSVIIPEYGIVWEGATGFIFFSPGEIKLQQYKDKNMILIIPFGDNFVINPFDNYQFKKDEIMKDIECFIEII